jgi:peptide/nickel transport system substrate-binding protein
MKITRALPFLALLLSAAACGREAPHLEAPEGDTLGGGPAGGTLVVLREREPDDLNPLTYTSLPASEIAHLVFRKLARRDSTLAGYVPDLAERWEVSDDGLRLLLHLRTDVLWHDGVPTTADDVVFTIERQRDPATASHRQADVAAVASVAALDSFTVEVRFSRAGPYVVNALLEVMPAPRHLLGEVPPEGLRLDPFGRSPVGNGLFRFVSWRAGESVTLEANADRPDGRPALDRIVVRFVPDLTTALTEVLAGQADLLKIPAELRQQVERSPGVRLESGARIRLVWIAWNTARAPLDDVRVRRAITLGIDREALTRGLFGDVGEVAVSPIPPTLPEHDPRVRSPGVDTAGARVLLEEIGYRRGPDGIMRRDGQPLRVEIDYIATDAMRRDALVILQAQLRRIGVELVPRAYESTAWVERLRAGEFQGSLWGWGWGPGVAGPNAEMVFHSRSVPPNGPNFAGMRDARVDALIDRAQVVFDEEERRQLWSELEQRLIDAMVYVPLFLDPELYAVSERFENASLWGLEWWEDVHLWWVPPERRLPRDRTR